MVPARPLVRRRHCPAALVQLTCVPPARLPRMRHGVVDHAHRRALSVVEGVLARWLAALVLIAHAIRSRGNVTGRFSSLNLLACDRCALGPCCALGRFYARPSSPTYSDSSRRRSAPCALTICYCSTTTSTDAGSPWRTCRRPTGRWPRYWTPSRSSSPIDPPGGARGHPPLALTVSLSPPTFPLPPPGLPLSLPALYPRPPAAAR